MCSSFCALALHDAREGDAGHVGDDLLDVLDVDHVLLDRDRALPALLDLVDLALELPDHVAHGRGLLVVLRVHEARLLQRSGARSPSRGRRARWGRMEFRIRLREPDSSMRSMALSGQEALGDVAPRERGRRLEGVVGVDHAGGAPRSSS